MATLYDNNNDNENENKKKTQSATLEKDRDAELQHNLGISEAYRFLADTVDRQLGEIQRARETARNLSATIEIERPAHSEKVEPTHVQEPYVRDRRASDLFKPETLDRILQKNGYGKETHESLEVVAEKPVEEVAGIEVVAVEKNASLSTFAKTVIAAFFATVTIMISMISINTQVLNQKVEKINQLEQTRNELVARNIQLRNQIEDVTSEESIEEFALSNGMIKAE